MLKPTEPGAGTARPIVHAREVYKTYGTGADAVEALRNVSLQVGRGEFVCLLGASGAVNQPFCG